MQHELPRRSSSRFGKTARETRRTPTRTNHKFDAYLNKTSSNSYATEASIDQIFEKLYQSRDMTPGVMLGACGLDLAWFKACRDGRKNPMKN